ncbi:hypothetical protein [Orientia tsutsugamushi]|nr:hypothetical protein [Orientia tsutsugamushi]
MAYYVPISYVIAILESQHKQSLYSQATIKQVCYIFFEKLI